MKGAIETTMDRAGRLVVPKAVREEAGLRPGAPLRITVSGGTVEITPAPRRVKTVRRGRLAVVVAEGEGPQLTAETVRKTQALVRRRSS